MRIAVVLPTRGLVFTEVEEAIEKARWTFISHMKKVEIRVFRSTSLPIPESHNHLTEVALSNYSPEYIWFIEEDTVPPRNALYDLIKADADIAFIDYSINGWACAAKTPEEILWCGLGCTLVKADVFKKLEKPYFRTDKSLSLNDDTYFQWLDQPNKYGGHDIWFFSKAREAGFKLVQVPGECKHMQIHALGTSAINDGLHIISQKRKIEKHMVYERPLTFSTRSDNNTDIGNTPDTV